jgi:uncharacterized Zn finger protein
VSRSRTRTSVRRWEDLEWSDLEEWFGERSLERGRSYFRSGHVSQLAKAADGTLLATVQGTERYATAVSLGGGDSPVTGRCSCPIGGQCKHAVAVILAYLDAVENKQPVPVADPDDRRWDKLDREAEPIDEDDWGDDDREDEDWEDEEPDDRRVTRSPASAPRRRNAATPDRVRAMVAGWSEERKLEYILAALATHPDLRAGLEDQATLQSDDVRDLIRDTRKLIRKRTGEEAWSNSWNGDGHVPDYDGVRQRFEKLLAAAEYDALLDLGRELFDLGTAQVEQSNDEGETATAIHECLAVAAKAVPLSGRDPADQLVFCIDLILADEYDIADPFAEVTDRSYPKKVWSAVADRLRARVGDDPRRDDDFSGRYARKKKDRWIALALERAGRGDEALAFLEAEAEATDNYPEIVQRYMAAGRPEDAQRWALKGIAATKAQWPGIAAQLHDLIREMAVARKDWPLVAAYDARPFFEHPTVHSWQTMLASAKKAGVEAAIAAVGRAFAETGTRPAKPVWPLPDVPDPSAKPGTGRAERPTDRRPAGPSYHFLIDLAIEEKRLADALQWYDRWVKADRRGYSGANQYAEHVADAARGEFPEWALEVYRRGAEAELARTGDSAYRRTVKYLRKMKEVLESLGRSAEWTAYEAGLREQYKRRKKFIHLLDRMKRSKIIGGEK